MQKGRDLKLSKTMWDFAGVSVLEFSGEVDLAIIALVILKLHIWPPAIKYSQVDVNFREV